MKKLRLTLTGAWTPEAIEALLVRVATDLEGDAPSPGAVRITRVPLEDDPYETFAFGEAEDERMRVAWHDGPHGFPRIATGWSGDPSTPDRTLHAQQLGSRIGDEWKRLRAAVEAHAEGRVTMRAWDVAYTAATLLDAGEPAMARELLSLDVVRNAAPASEVGRWLAELAKRAGG